jgi:hypothetical protein
MLRGGDHEFLAGHLIAALSGAIGALGYDSTNTFLKGEQR